jgi:putative salt-induced outer membrane protein YdiY
VAPAPVQGQEPELGWTYSVQLSAVWAGGNTESRTLGLGSTARWIGARDELKLELAGIRSDGSIKTWRAVGTTGSYRIEVEEEDQKSAESYLARGRYDRKLGSGFVVFTGTDWRRNTFAGIDSHLLIAAGAGRLWVERPELRVKTDLAATYSFQEDVVENPFVKSSFPGARLSGELMLTPTTTSKWESTLISDLNLDETDDVRVNLNTALSLTMTNRLALKPALELLWRNQPSLRSVDLFTEAGAPTAVKVTTPLEKLDSFFTLALVITL